MAPTNPAGLIVDVFEAAFAPNAVIRPCPAVNSIGRLGKIDAVTGMGVDDKQSVPGVEARGTVVGKTSLVGGNQASVGRRLLGGVWNRAALVIDSKRPVHRSEKSGQKVFAVRAVENKEVAVARGLHEHSLRLAVKISVDQHRSLNRIPVVGIVRRGLEV